MFSLCICCIQTERDAHCGCTWGQKQVYNVTDRVTERHYGDEAESLRSGGQLLTLCLCVSVSLCLCLFPTLASLICPICCGSVSLLRVSLCLVLSLCGFPFLIHAISLFSPCLSSIHAYQNTYGDYDGPELNSFMGDPSVLVVRRGSARNTTESVVLSPDELFQQMVFSTEVARLVLSPCFLLRLFRDFTAIVHRNRSRCF